MAIAHDAVEGRGLPSDRDDVSTPNSGEARREPSVDEASKIAHDPVALCKEQRWPNAVGCFRSNAVFEPHEGFVDQRSWGHAAAIDGSQDGAAYRAFGKVWKAVRGKQGIHHRDPIALSCHGYGTTLYENRDMQRIGDQLIYSASDLNNALECSHLVELERLVAYGERERPAATPGTELLSRKGLEHELHQLEHYRERYGSGLIEFDQRGGRTIEELRAA